MAVTIECTGVGFSYDSQPVLREISFQAAAGTFYVLLGRNGSGKTTLLHCLNGVLSPTSGDVRINSVPVAAMTRREIARHVSLVPQEHAELFPFKVLDVVVMGRAPFLSITSGPGRADYQMARDALERLNAGYLAGCHYNRISGGERQMVALAAALVQSESIMLLDEPTNHLDFNHQYHLLSTIRQLCRNRQTCVIASIHDPNLARLFADHVIMIKDGGIIASGPTGSVMTARNISLLYGTVTRQIDIGRNAAVFLPEVMTQDL